MISGAVVYGLDYRSDGDKQLTPQQAREVLKTIEMAEPADKIAHLCGVLAPPRLETHSTGKGWSVRCIPGFAASDRAWGRVFGLEAGWLAYDRAGFLCWTEKGRDRFAAGPADTFPESATGQIAFAF